MVYVIGHDTCAPIVSAAFDLSVDLHVFSHKLLSGFIDLRLSGSQLLHAYARWGLCLPFGFATYVDA